MTIVTASSPCVPYASDSPTLPVCDASVPSTTLHQTLIETNFSPWWAIYFTLLAIILISIPVAALLHVRTRAPLWRWVLIALAVVALLGAAPIDDSLRFVSPIAILQGGVSLLPGVVLGIVTAIMIFLDSRHPAAIPGREPAIQA